MCVGSVVIADLGRDEGLLLPDDGQVKRVSGIRRIQVETVLNRSRGEMRRDMG